MLLSSISLALTRLGQRLGRWSPLALWPDGISSAGMWISPRDLTSQWADYTGTTPVSVPGTVADASNPVGLALDIRAGATVLTDPGLHMLQSTSADRPLLSARANLLTYTENFYITGGPWFASGFSAASTANNLIPSTSSGGHTFGQSASCAVGVPLTAILRLKPNGYNTAVMQLGGCTGTPTAFFNASTGVITSETGSPSASMQLQSDGSYICQIHGVSSSTTPGLISYVVDLDNTTLVFAGDGTKALNYISAQINIGTEALPYQPIPTGGSTYSSTGFPIAQRYNGTNSCMATAAFSAGTLTSGMDCMIAVRRDAANHVILGPYNAPGDLTKYIGNAELNYYSACYRGVGSPTVWVDNVQLTNGWASELHTAVTVGDWHILEFRGLDLSAWTGLGSGSFGYTGYNLNGPRGDILLYPSTASTTDKDAARQWLADYYGVTLP